MSRPTPGPLDQRQALCRQELDQRQAFRRRHELAPGKAGR
jgi:hypothetical protein